MKFELLSDLSKACESEAACAPGSCSPTEPCSPDDPYSDVYYPDADAAGAASQS